MKKLNLNSMSEYAFYLPINKDVEEIVALYAYGKNWLNNTQDRFANSVKYAVAGLYKKFIQNEKSNKNKIEVLKKFLDGFAYESQVSFKKDSEKDLSKQKTIISFPDSTDFFSSVGKIKERRAFVKAGNIICEKFEKVYAKEIKQYNDFASFEEKKTDSTLDVELRNL